MDESWRRCASLLSTRHTAPVGIDDHESRWRDSAIWQAAAETVDELGHLAVKEDYLAAVIDTTGHIIWSAAGPSMARRAERVNFVRGACWHEATAGTNAPGLALHTGRSASVFATEHWCDSVQDWVCYAAPVRSPGGVVVGVLDLSAPWKHASPLALSTVTTTARLVEQQLISRPPVPAPVSSQHLRLRLFGHPGAELGGDPVRLSLRQLEILAILGVREQASVEELHDCLYGERPVKVSTLKAEVSHLRQVLGRGIQSRPYRLTLAVDADLLDTMGALRRGQVGVALAAYAGQLLPASESPFIVDLRHHVDVSLRTALLGQGDPSQLLRYSEVHPFDLEILERAGQLIRPDHHLYPELAARLLRAGLDRRA